MNEQQNSKSALSKAVKLTLVFIFLPVLYYANMADTSFVRLNNGARIKGEIISKTQNSIIIRNQKIGPKEINWKDITFLSSQEVYDSLTENNSIIILPPAKSKKSFLRNNLSAEFMIGKGFDFNRFVGFGVRANILLSNLFTVGGIVTLHIGSNGSFSADGYGPLFFWGPEVGLRINTEYFIIEPSISIGEGTYQIGNEYIKRGSNNVINSSTESNLFFAPSLGIKLNYGMMRIGLHYKYVIINNQNMSGLYISFGS